MKAFATTNIGIEDISALEVKELIAETSKIKKGIVLFNFKDFKDLFKLCYKAQSMQRICIFLDSYKIKSLEDINISEEAIPIINELLKDSSFRVNCEHIDNDEFKSPNIEQALGKLIAKKTNATPELKNPSITIFAYIVESQLYIGIDLAGFDLSKRDYRVFANKNAIKANIAYSLSRIADIKPNDIILDPFIKSGEIVIEAALFINQLSTNYFRKDSFNFLNLKKFKDFDDFFENLDKDIKTNKLTIYGYDSLLKNVKAAQKNAKIANINKALNLSRINLDDLELKFKQNTVDKIITHPPDISKLNQKEMEKLYNEFFYQANYILKKQGLIVIASNKKQEIIDIAKKNKFKLSNQRTVFQGKKEMFISVFEKE